MPYLAIDNYKNGLDARKSPLTTPAGALSRLTNAAVTPGGEIEKRRAFVKVASLAGTKGLAAVGNKVVAFSLNTDMTAPDLGMIGASLEFHKLPYASTTARMMDYDVFDGSIYVTFYDKTPSPPAPASSGATNPTGVATGAIYQLSTDKTYHRWSGKAWQNWTVNFTLPHEPGAVEGRTFHNNLANRNYKFTGGMWVTMVPKVSTGSAPDATQYKVGDTYFNTTNGQTYIIKTAGTWSLFTPDATGDELPPIAKEGDIYHNTTSKLDFLLKGGAWVAWAPAAVVAALPASPPIKDQVFLNTTDGKTYIWSGTAWVAWAVSALDYNPHFYDTSDPDTTTRKYEKTEGSGKGYFVKSYQTKMYSIWGRHVAFSAIKYPKLWEEISDVPPSGATVVSVLPIQGVQNEFIILPAKKKCYTWTVFDDGTANWVASDPSTEDLAWIEESDQRNGCGYMDVALQESGGIGLQGLEIYFDKLAVLSEQTSQLWSMDPDPDQNALAQVLRNNGTRAPKSVQQYGSGDVLYLNSSGLRSMKARDASNSAAVTDIGSPVDRIILQIAREKGLLYLKNCKAIIEPIVGRFWAVFPNEILVLSYFPGPAITAWSLYTVPFTIDYIVSAGDHIFVRSGDDLYAFGGKTGEEYDACPVEVRFPYLDGGKPGHNKMFEALDATVEGAWKASVSYNFDLPEAEEFLGTMTSPTWNKGRFGMQGYASHVSMRFYHEAPGPATLCNAAIHFRVADDEA